MSNYHCACGDKRCDGCAEGVQILRNEAVQIGVDGTLADRAKTYGSFATQADITQDLKITMRGSRNWNGLPNDMKEALEMNASKIARILNGDPNYSDSWHDIAGYALLIEKRLTTKETT